MSKISDAGRKAQKSIPPDAKCVPAPEGLPLVVDVGTRNLLDSIRLAAANPNHHSMVIFFDFDDDLAIGTRPDTGDLNQEEIRRILEMSANWPLRIRTHGTFEE